MKKKILIVTLMICISIVGCSEKQGNAQSSQSSSSKMEDNSKSSQSAVESSESSSSKAEDNSKSSQSAVESSEVSQELSNLITDEGTYHMMMAASLYGKPNGDMGSIFSIDISSDYIEIRGSMNAGMEFDKNSLMQNDIYYFKITSDTQFIIPGGGGRETKYLNGAAFLKYAKECSDSGLSFIVKVQEGVAVSASISS